MKQVGTLVLPDGEMLQVFQTQYTDGQTAIEIFAADGPYARLSVNMAPDYVCQDGEFVVKSWSGNEEIVEIAEASGLFEYAGKVAGNGLVFGPVWKLKG
jgi:hypothetical protein